VAALSAELAKRKLIEMKINESQQVMTNQQAAISIKKRC
jgi:hypothetical protein